MNHIFIDLLSWRWTDVLQFAQPSWLNYMLLKKQKAVDRNRLWCCTKGQSIDNFFKILVWVKQICLVSFMLLTCKHLRCVFEEFSSTSEKSLPWLILPHDQSAVVLYRAEKCAVHLASWVKVSQVAWQFSGHLDEWPADSESNFVWEYMCESLILHSPLEKWNILTNYQLEKKSLHCVPRLCMQSAVVEADSVIFHHAYSHWSDMTSTLKTFISCH